MKEKIKPFHWWQHTKEQRNGIAARWFDKKFGENTGYGIYNKILEIMLCADGCIKNDEIELYSADISVVDDDKLMIALDYGVLKGIFYEHDGGYRCEFIDGVYAHGLKLSESMKRDKQETKIDLKEPNLEPKNPQNDHKCVKTNLKDANLGESDPKKEPKKAKGEPKDDPETDASKAVKAHIAALEDDFGAKNISNMSNVECAKIQAKYGAMTAYALRTYFLWKVSKGKRGGKDYLSLLAKWVQEEVEKESAKPHVETVVLPSKTPEEIALGEERRKMILERAGFGK